MNLNDELSRIRADLEGVDRSVARLRQRLDEVEARQRAAESVAAPEAPRAAAAPAPPPLPLRPVARAADTAAIISAQAASAPVAPAAKPTVSAARAPVATPKKVAPVPEEDAWAKLVRRFGPPEGVSWEMALGTYWLPRIGIPLMAMAVVYGFTYVADQFRDAAWMPWARVATGLLISGGLSGIGWKLEKKYPAYGRLLMGGGLGVLYFVIFATWYVPQTRISPSQEFTLLCLGLLVASWGAIAQWRQSQIVAFFMTLMGHFTVALSTLTLETPSRAAVGGLLLLGIGSVWFLYRNGWYLVAMTAMAGSYLNQFLWLANAPAGGGVPEFCAGMAILAAYLVNFAIADRITPVAFAAPHPRIRNLYCGLNTGGFVLLGLALIQGFEFARPYDQFLYFATALFGLGMGWSYAQRSDARFYPPGAGAADGRSPAACGDPLAGIYFTKASVLATIGFAAWLDGAGVTLSIAMQSLALLVAARQSQRPIGRLLALGTAAVAFAHGAYTWAMEPLPVYGADGYWGVLIEMFGSAVVFGIVAELYRVTPWHTFPRMPYAIPSALEGICRDLEIVPAAPGEGPRPSRMVLSHLLALAGVLLLIANTKALMALEFAAPSAASFSLAVVAAGLMLRSAPLLSGAVFLSGAGALWWMEHLLGTQSTERYPLLLAALVLAPPLAISELLRVWAPVQFRAYALFNDIQGAWLRNAVLAANLFAAGAALLTGATVLERMAPESGFLLLGALALAATVYAAARSSANLGLYGLIIAACGAVTAIHLGGPEARIAMALGGLLMLGAAASAVESRWWGERAGLAFHRLLPVPYLVYGFIAWDVLWLIDWQVADAAQPAAMVALAALLALAMPWLHARAMASIGTALVVLATLVWRAEYTGGSPATGWHVSAGALLLAALAGDRYFAVRKPFAKPWPDRILLVCAWAACVHYNRELAVAGWHYTGLAAVSLGFLGYAALFRGGTAAILALVSAAIATFTLVLDPNTGLALAPLCAAYLSLIVFWLCAERGTAVVLERTQFKLAEGHDLVLGLLLTGIPALLGVLCLARIEMIHDFYLTMSWTVWALAIFCWALATRQPWFRYMGLATFGLALGRAFLVDVWKLEGLYRAGAMLALGAALLSVAYGYTRWRASQERVRGPEGGGEAGPEAQE